MKSNLEGRWEIGRLLLCLSVLASLAAPAADDTLRINGSTTVAPVVAEAAEVLREREGLRIEVDTQGGSSGGISQLGEGRVEIGMSSKPLTGKDRKRFPGADFRPVHIGSDALALVVSEDVWEGGVRSLGREEVRNLYEGKIRNWKELGGPDRRVVFFNKEPGRGTWEVFIRWAYGSVKDAPLVSLPEVGANREARSKVAGTRGAITQLSAAWADGETVYALSLRQGGETIAPSRENILDGGYPLSRSLFVIHRGEPAGAVKRMLDLLLSPEGQALVVKHGYVPVSALEPEAAE